MGVVENLKVDNQKKIEQKVQTISQYVVNELSSRFCTNLVNEEISLIYIYLIILIIFNMKKN